MTKRGITNAAICYTWMSVLFYLCHRKGTNNGTPNADGDRYFHLALYCHKYRGDMFSSIGLWWGLVLLGNCQPLLTTMGSRIKPMKGLGMEYRSAVSSIDATTEFRGVLANVRGRERILTVVRAEWSNHGYTQKSDKRNIKFDTQHPRVTTYPDAAAITLIVGTSSSCWPLDSKKSGWVLSFVKKVNQKNE